MQHTLNVEQLKAATLAGGVSSITLRGDGAAFVVDIKTLRFNALLVTSRRQPRRFADPRKALLVLRGAGWTDCQIDAAQWQPQDAALAKSQRPDRSLALKAAHEAARHDEDYDQWFRAKVQQSLDGLADGSNRVLSAQEVAESRAQLRARAVAASGQKRG